MTLQSRSIVFTEVGKVGIVPTDLSSFRPEGALAGSDVLVELEITTISPGTEMRCLAGQQPGAPDFPFIPGYAGAGVVIEAGPDAADLLGKRVQTGGSSRVNVNSSWGGQSSHILTTASAVNVIPDGVSFADASMAHMLGIAHRGLVVSKPQPGQTVAIIGLGLIGQLSTRWFSTTEAKVAAFDLSAERCAVAALAGISAQVPSAGLSASVREVFAGGADIVVDATGSLRVLPESLAAVADLGWGDWDQAPKLVIQGSYPENVVFNYQDAFRKELTIHLPRDCSRKDMIESLDALADGSYSVRGIIGEEFAPEDAPEAYRRLVEEPNRAITYAIRWK